jgi:transposase
MFTLGFDVAKDKLDAALINRSGQLKERFVFTNTPKAITELLKVIRSKHPKLCCGCEATGHYHVALVRACLSLGIEVRILNPLMTKQFTRATIRGRKTDTDDALSIARLILRGEGRAANLSDIALPKLYVRLATKVAQQRQALDLQIQFLEALETEDAAPIREQFVPAITALDKLSLELRAHAASQVNPRDYELLQSIVGIGPQIAVSILAEIGDINRFPSSKQLIAFAGFDPKQKQSGTSLNRTGRLTKRGSPELRRVLFLAGTSARRYDPELKEYYLKKRKEGKRYTPAVIAVTQKVTNRVYAVLTRQTPYVTKST